MIESLRPGEANCQLCKRRAAKTCYLSVAERDRRAALEAHDCDSFVPVTLKTYANRLAKQAPPVDQPGLF